MTELRATITKLKSNLVNPAFLRTFLRQNAIIVSFLILFIVLSLATHVFFSTRNIRNILDQTAQVGIIACGMTVVIIAGGFDLSVGATFAITGVTAAVVANQVGSVYGYLAGVILGLVIGMINGVVVSKLRINSFIATMASTLIIRGIGNLFVSGQLISVKALNFNFLGRGEFLGARISIFLFIIVIAMIWFLLKQTTIGRHIFAVGGNADASLLSGVKVDNIRIIAFGINGLCAGIAGVLAASRISTGLMEVGSGLELEAIAAVVIGGTSVMGGEGAIWRSVLGILLLHVILNGFNILTIPPFYQQIFEGLIIIIAVAIETVPRRET
jgi:ribose transport system permease protein